jgi:hypothetical protein
MDEAELLPLVDPASTKAAGSPQRHRREVLCFVPLVRRIHPVRTAGADSDEAAADKLERHKREKPGAIAASACDTGRASKLSQRDKKARFYGEDEPFRLRWCRSEMKNRRAVEQKV